MWFNDACPRDADTTVVHADGSVHQMSVELKVRAPLEPKPAAADGGGRRGGAGGGAGGWANAKYQTIIHGDPKAANVFFKSTAAGSAPPVDAGGGGDSVGGGSDPAAEMEVGLIDLQWCGRGLGAVDIAYCIAASAGGAVFGSGGDAAAVTQRLLDDYHAHLLAGRWIAHCAFIEMGRDILR